MTEKLRFNDHVEQAVSCNMNTSLPKNIVPSRKCTILSEDEIELLAGYRTLNLREKAQILGLVDNIIPAQIYTGFHRKVGQQVIGNLTGPQTFNFISEKKKTDYFRIVSHLLTEKSPIFSGHS